MSTLTVDNLEFTLRRSDRRKTLGITIERDGELVVTAPAGTSEEEIERLVRQKGLWIYRKLAEREFVVGPGREKEYVPGETFYYLGRSYRLRLVTGENGRRPLQLQHGWFELSRDERDRGERHFIDWYVAHGTPWLTRRVALWAPRLGVEAGPVRVQDLGYRWGSCGEQALNFHWRTVQLPPRIIDYVVLHELVHVLEPRHDVGFWQRVERGMPDYAARKQWLAEQGHQF